MTGPINGSATAELVHWRDRALAAEARVRLLLGAIRDVHRRAEEAAIVAAKVEREQHG